MTENIEPPDLQVEIWFRGEFVARTDFLWQRYLVIGEADGRSKYETVDHLYQEKRREESLRDLGFEIVRWDWQTAHRRSTDLVDTLRRAFAKGARGVLAPGVVLRPTALGLAA